MSATAARRAGAALSLLALSIAVASVSRAATDAHDELKPFQASYSWSWHGATVAVSTLELQHVAADNWIYSSTSEPRGLGHLYPMRPVLRSSLRITDQGVQPLSFKAGGSGDSHNADVRFDWSTGRATGVYEGTAIDMPIKPGIQDDLSVQIAMMLELLHGRTPDQLSMISRNSVREYLYRREGTDSLATPLGQVDTVIYSSQHPGSPRVTRFWCAPAMGFLPMRVEQKRLGKVEWIMEIRSIKLN